jgi:hypothetical protein
VSVPDARSPAKAEEVGFDSPTAYLFRAISVTEAHDSTKVGEKVQILYGLFD